MALTGGTCCSFEMSTRQGLWCVFSQHGIPHSKGSLPYMWARVRVCLAVPKNVTLPGKDRYAVPVGP